MGFVQGPVVPQLFEDEQAFANFDSESLFNYLEVMEKSATCQQPGGIRDPSSDGHVMRSSSRRQSANFKHASSKDAWVPSKNYVSEQKRRKKLNNSLLELRSLVPNITKVSSPGCLHFSLNGPCLVVHSNHWRIFKVVLTPRGPRIRGFEND